MQHATRDSTRERDKTYTYTIRPAGRIDSHTNTVYNTPNTIVHCMETRHKETKALYIYFTHTSRKVNQFLSEVQFSFVNIPSVARLSVSWWIFIILKWPSYGLTGLI